MPYELNKNNKEWRMADYLIFNRKTYRALDKSGKKVVENKITLKKIWICGLKQKD